MAKVKKWVPIKEFKGTFDGKGHALLNWKTKQGLFDLIAENGAVQNLRIDASCSMDVLTKCDEVIAGFIARVNKGTIRNCENGGSIKYKGAYTEKHIYIGGLVGQNGFVITDSRNTGNIDASLFIASESKTLNICVAGIASSTIPKGSRIIMINRCENSGKIELTMDFSKEENDELVLDIAYSDIGFADYRGTEIQTGVYRLSVSEKDRMISAYIKLCKVSIT